MADAPQEEEENAAEGKFGQGTLGVHHNHDARGKSVLLKVAMPHAAADLCCRPAQCLSAPTRSPMRR